MNTNYTEFIYEKNIFSNQNNMNNLVMRSIGYIKLNKFVIKLSLLEMFYNDYLVEEKYVYYFNFYHKKKLNISFLALYEILEYYNFFKIAGTSSTTFWKKRKNNLYKKIQYNKNSPFYILKKLQ